MLYTYIYIYIYIYYIILYIIYFLYNIYIYIYIYKVFNKKHSFFNVSTCLSLSRFFLYTIHNNFCFIFYVTIKNNLCYNTNGRNVLQIVIKSITIINNSHYIKISTLFSVNHCPNTSGLNPKY